MKSETAIGAPGSARRSLVRNLALLTLVTGGAILAVVLSAAHGAVSDLSASVIKRTTNQVEAQLASYFVPVRTNLEIARDWGRAGKLTDTSPDALNPRFMPVLERIPQVSSMMVANDRGLEYMLLRLDDVWRNRHTHVEDRGKRVQLRTTPRGEGEPRTWEEEVDYDPRGRPWYQGAVAQDGGAIHWTTPYPFFTTKDPGITASVRWRAAPDAPESVVAFDVMLKDVTEFTRNLDVSPNGEVLVLASDGCVIGFPNDPRFATDDERRKLALCRPTELGIPALDEAVGRWQSGTALEEVFAYDADGETWHAGFRPFDLGAQQLWIAVLVPEDDLLQGLDEERNLIVLITVLALGVGVLMGVRADRAYRARMATEVAKARRLGQYTLVSKIGAGGMGQVFHARHSMLRRPTAVKLLHADVAGTDMALKRFEREVQTTAGLTHPNTIAIYDYGRTPEGVFYYAMEYVEGIALDDLVEHFGPQPPGRVIHLLRQACGSLHEAHGVGLVHRDVKPQNLMLCQRGAVHDVVKVLDFGLVKDVSSTDASVSTTSPGTISGTPLYMSPESIKRPQDVDGRSDLYAIGAVGYLLLTGATLFDGRTAIEILTKQIGDAPERPSERIGRPLPDDLEEVVLKCLAKKAEERYQSAAELDAALAACADAGTWTQADAAAWWERHGDAVAALRLTPTGETEPPTTGFTVNLETRA